MDILFYNTAERGGGVGSLRTMRGWRFRELSYSLLLRIFQEDNGYGKLSASLLTIASYYFQIVSIHRNNY